MKVLFYLYRYPGLGGIETVTTLLANYLQKHGVDVCFFSEKCDDIHLPLCSSIKIYHQGHHSLQDAFREVLLHENINMVVLHDNYDADAETIVSVLKELHIPLIVQEHSDPMGTITGAKRFISDFRLNNIRNVLWRIKNYNYVSRVTNRYLDRKMLLLDASCKYVLLSKRFEKSLIACIPQMEQSKVMAINNPLTVNVDESALLNKEKRVVFLSRFEGVKGVEYMAEIFSRCADANKDWSFEIYGDGSQRSIVEALANGHDNISYHGITDNVSGVLRSASILIMTSSFEGWGLVLTEAMANGCIPMAFDSYLSVRDIIEDGIDGVLVSPYNVNEYCDKLQSLINDDKRRKSMAVKCIDKARRFEISNVIGNQWMSLLKEPVRRKIAIASSNRSHLLDVARELSNLGSYDVMFYTFTPKWRLRKYNIDINHTVSLFWFCAAGILLNRLSPSEFSRELQRILLDWSASHALEHCDVFICQSPYFDKSMRVARDKYGAKVVLDRGSTHVRKFQEYAREYSTHVMPEWYMRFDENQYQYADYIAIASEHVKNSFLCYGISDKKLFVNPYGFDSRNFYPTKLEADSEAYDLIYVGQWSRRKGCNLLIELCQKYGYRLLHVGSVFDIPFPNDLGNMTHVDSQPESLLVNYYKKAKVFVLPSYDEGLSLVQAQAIACGLPLVISTRTGGRDLRGFVDKPEYIIEFDGFSIGAIHEALQKALALADRQCGIRNYAGLKFKNIDWKSYAVRYDTFIKKILR